MSEYLDDISALRRFGNMVKDYVDTDGDFKFIESPDLKFGFSTDQHLVCLLNKRHIAIPEEQFEQWSNNIINKLKLDGIKARLTCYSEIVINIVSTETFKQFKNNTKFLEKIGTRIASILEIIDGAIIDDWGDDLDDTDNWSDDLEDEDEDPYFT